MIKSTLGKVMWVGRATVFLVGLAVILALVVGVASTAFGTNGANFILGNGINDTAKNIATLTTRLTMNGTASAPGLQVTQQSTGTGASGVGITVPAGKAPIKVNSTAGKATNLNADKLDGQDSTAFQQANATAGGDLTGNYPNPQIGSDTVGTNEVENLGLTVADVATSVFQNLRNPGPLAANSCTTVNEFVIPGPNTWDSGDYLLVNPPVSLPAGLTVTPLRVSSDPGNPSHSMLSARLCNVTTSSVDPPEDLWGYVVFDDGNDVN